MPRWRVEFRAPADVSLYLEVEAGNADQAREKAREQAVKTKAHLWDIESIEFDGMDDMFVEGLDDEAPEEEVP